MIQFSFLIPTRGNLDGIARLFKSIIDTTACPEELEIILAIDDDDVESQKIDHEILNIKKLVVRKGATMGALNNTCFEASSGRYVILLNDDVILRTKNWDRIVASVFSSYQDDIALIHVNDLLFREKLCTFPMLSRVACLAIGICPTEYQRYRIDDHIYDIYNLLAYLGHKRIIYLPDVVFEHENHAADNVPANGQIFKSTDNKVYVPKQDIIEVDAKFFEQHLQDRKRDALKLASLIDESRFSRVRDRRQTSYRGLLKGVRDSYSYRRSDFVKNVPTSSGSPVSSVRTTIAVVTADLRSEVATQCLLAIKEHTSNYDLIILDNNGNREFSHSREMNKVLQIVETPYLVLMDDDVIVEKGWLEGLLKCMDTDTAVVAPMHKDKNGKLSFSGVYLAGDGMGTHEHTLDKPDRPRVMQCYCSAILLIDMRKCGHILMDEAYSKYFFDLVHGFEVWESGYKAVCTPHVTVTHVGGATMNWGSPQANDLLKKDRATFIREWMESERLKKLEEGIWQKFPYLKSLVEIPQRINRIFNKAESFKLSEFKSQVAELFVAAKNYNLFKSLLKARLHKCMLRSYSRRNYENAKFCQAALIKLRSTMQNRGNQLTSQTRNIASVMREKTLTAQNPTLIQEVKSREIPLISAIVSVYEAERFMRGLLENLEAQTITDQLEIIIIDSNSPQNERAIVEEFQRHYDNIVYMRTEKRETSHAAVNRGIKIARGKYITLANADDRHRVDALERMAEVLEANPDIGLVYANLYITKTENETFEDHTGVGRFRWLDFDPLRLIFGCFIGPQPMWRKSIHKKYGYFDPSFESAGDWEFWLRIAETERFLHIDEFLGLYLYSPNSVEHRNLELSRREALKVHQMYLPRAARFACERGLGPVSKEQKSQKKAAKSCFGLGLPLLLIVGSEGYSPKQLEKCLLQVQKHTKDLPRCLVVGSEADGHLSAKLKMEVAFDRGETLLSALNQSLASGVERVALLSADVLVYKGWLEKMIETIDGNGNTSIAAVGPSSNQAPAPQRIEPHYRSLDGGLNKFAKQRQQLYNGHWKQVPHLGGFCLLLNLDIVRQAGGLPRSMSLSDALWDLFVRLRSANYKLVFMPGIYVHHDRLNLNEGGDFDQRAKTRSQELAKLSEEEFNLQNFAKAGELLEESLNLDPHNAEALNNLGVMLLQTGMVAEALDLFERAASLDPENEEIASNQKETSLLFQKLSRFNGHIRNLLTRNKKMMKSKEVQGEAKQAVSNPKEEMAMEEKNKIDHDLDEAIDVYRKLARDDPQNVENLTVLSEKLTEAGQYDEAVGYWENLLKLSPNSSSYQSLSNCYYKLGEYEKAEGALLKGLELNPKDTEIFNDLGVVAMARWDLEGAMNYFQKGLKSNPDSPDILLNLALICYQVGLYEETAGLLERYSGLEAPRADVHLCLGDCYFNLERKDLAKKEFEKALSLDPDLKEAEKKLKELQG